MTILKINSSVKTEQSVSRALVDQLVERLKEDGVQVIDRDLSKGVPLLTQDMVNAFYTPEAKRTEAQKNAIAFSDNLVEELEQADTIVLGVPIYNFSVPASVKAYFDLVARVGRTFKYSGNGPNGLLKGKKAIIVIASGGTVFQSAIDFASNYIKHFLGFIGIDEVHFVPADRLMADKEGVIKRAQKAIEILAGEQLRPAYN